MWELVVYKESWNLNNFGVLINGVDIVYIVYCINNILLVLFLFFLVGKRLEGIYESFFERIMIIY